MADFLARVAGDCVRGDRNKSCSFSVIKWGMLDGEGIEKEEEVREVKWLSVEEPQSSLVFPLGTTAAHLTRWDSGAA
jgi:hypothetical protein